MNAQTRSDTVGAEMLLRPHFFDGYHAYERGDAYDADYGAKNCTHYPAASVQCAYEEGRLAACQARSRVDIAKKRWKDHASL